MTVVCALVTVVPLPLAALVNFVKASLTPIVLFISESFGVRCGTQGLVSPGTMNRAISDFYCCGV